MYTQTLKQMVFVEIIRHKISQFLASCDFLNSILGAAIVDIKMMVRFGIKI